MAKKTNRTSHVMDLLTNGASGEAPETVSEAPSPGQEKKSDVQSHTVTPAKVTVVDEGSINDRVSQEILGKLTEELEAEAREQAPAPEQTAPETVQAEAPSQDSAAPAEADSATAPKAPEIVSQTPAEADSAYTAPEASQDAQDVSEAAPAEAPASGTTEASGSKKMPHPIIPESHFTSHTQNREYRFVNVMEQLLMRQDLDAVLKQHNVCTCPRCMTDVCALTLTGLPPKYVVTSKDSISPLLSYYENKYRIPILTELMKACNKVRESPRHKKMN